ncbi:MAG: hypothetical protein KC464_32830 [Myxococcales bacterium]|nr:hypothetical protein [Myxococcales bacterium]
MKRPHVTLAALLCVLGALGAPRRVEAAVDDASTAVLHTSREGFSPRVELALGMVPGGGVVILVDHARTGRTTWDDIALAAFDVATLPLNVQWFIDGYRALRWGLRALDLVETAGRVPLVGKYLREWGMSLLRAYAKDKVLAAVGRRTIYHGARLLVAYLDDAVEWSIDGGKAAWNEGGRLYAGAADGIETAWHWVTE